LDPAEEGAVGAEGEGDAFVDAGEGDVELSLATLRDGSRRQIGHAW